MTSLLELIDGYRQGTYPVFAAGPVLSIKSLRAGCLRLDRVLQHTEDMATQG
jgi:hypothetical protein